MWREENKYSRWYDAMMDKARQRADLARPYERHHIWPIACGGDPKSETVLLTFREHFLAHWMLTKFVVGTTNTRKMRYALEQMTWINDRNNGRYLISSWQYAAARRAKSAAVAQRNKDYPTSRPEVSAKISASLVGNKRGTGQKIGYKQSEESKKKTGEASARWWRTATPEQIAARNKKISDKLQGHPPTFHGKTKNGCTRKGP